MTFESWEAVYTSNGQALWSLWLAPLAFLLFRARHGPLRGGVVPSAARFVDLYCLIFAIETLIDPLCTTVAVKALGWADTAAATGTGLLFVLLGDWRVFVLVLGLSEPRGQWLSVAFRAALLTALVPVGAFALSSAAQAWIGAPLQARWLWLAHETLFVALALLLRGFWVPRATRGDTARSRFLRAILAYAAIYYAFWATADVIILAGIDAGFAVRILPNQLYYSFWVPFVWWRFRRGEPGLRS